MPHTQHRAEHIDSNAEQDNLHILWISQYQYDLYTFHIHYYRNADTQSNWTICAKNSTSFQNVTNFNDFLWVCGFDEPVTSDQHSWNLSDHKNNDHTRNYDHTDILL